MKKNANRMICSLALAALLLVSCSSGGTQSAHGTAQSGGNTIDQLIAAEEAAENAASASGSTLMPPTNYAETAPDNLPSGSASSGTESAPGLESPDTDGNFGLGIPTEPAPPTLNGTEDGIDVDLTKMNSNMVYAEVSNMVYFPDQYVGKKIRMDGSFVLAYSMVEEDEYYYACLIEDALACCAQGIEFVREGDYKYPEDYPGLGDPITVTGTFELYTDEADGLEYMHLVNAEMEQGEGASQ